MTVCHKIMIGHISPTTSSYMNPLRVTALISSSENDKQGAEPDASQGKENNNYHVTWL